jgi:hypothetical protein
MVKDMVDAVHVLLGAAIPPSDADPEKMFWYRVRVATVACLAFTGLIASDAIAYGTIPWFDGFARASELHYVRVHLLDDQLLALRIHHCNATNVEAKQEYLRRIQILEDEYRDLMHIPYDLPGCQELQ